MTSTQRIPRLPRRSCSAMVSAAAVGALLATAVPAFAQAKTPKTPKPPKLPVNLVIYRGDSLQTSGLSLASWGSGTWNPQPTPASNLAVEARQSCMNPRFNADAWVTPVAAMNLA